jgi:hypothetical protein
MSLGNRPLQQYRNCWGLCFLLGPPRGYIKMIPGRLRELRFHYAVENQPVKRRLEGWCEMTASLGVSWGMAVQLSSARETETRWRYCWVDKEFYTDGCDKRSRAWEAEESPLLTYVTRKRLLKTLQPGEDLACSEWFVKYGDQRWRCNCL